MADKDNEPNYLNIIRKGASRDPSKDIVQRQPEVNDPLARYSSSSNIQRANQAGQFSQTERDPLILFQPHNTQEPGRPSRPSSPIKQDSNLGRASPLREEQQRKPSPHRQQTWTTSEAGFVQIQKPEDSRQSFTNQASNRAGSKSPQRYNTDAIRDRSISQSRTEQLPRQTSERADIRLTNPIRPEYDQMSRNRQTDSMRLSNLQNSSADGNFDKFNKYYRDQDSKRQSLKNEFNRKSREELQKELKRLNSQKQYSIVVFLAALSSIVLLFGSFYFQHFHKKPYCDTGRSSSPECDSCPENAKCSGGELTSCDYGFKQRGDICIRQESNERLVFMMYTEVIDILSRLRGEFVARNKQVKYELTTEEISKYLTNRFSQEEDFDRSLFEVKRRLTSTSNPDVELDYSTGFTRIRSSKEIYSWGAMATLFFSAYKYWLYFAGLIIIVSCWFIWKINQEIILRRKAQRYCKLLETYLISTPNNFMLEATLKRALCKETNIRVNELDQLWPYLRYEASSRQIEFVNKEEGGNTQVGWWIDPQNSLR